MGSCDGPMDFGSGGTEGVIDGCGCTKCFPGFLEMMVSVMYTRGGPYRVSIRKNPVVTMITVGVCDGTLSSWSGGPQRYGGGGCGRTGRVPGFLVGFLVCSV